MTDSAHPDSRPSADRLMTADEVADWLRVPRSTVYQLTRSRRIPFLKVGRRVLFDHGSVAAWVAVADDPAPRLEKARESDRTSRDDRAHGREAQLRDGTALREARRLLRPLVDERRPAPEPPDRRRCGRRAWPTA